MPRTDLDSWMVEGHCGGQIQAKVGLQAAAQLHRRQAVEARRHQGLVGSHLRAHGFTHEGCHLLRCRFWGQCCDRVLLPLS